MHLMVNPHLSLFSPSVIWKAKAPSKVRLLVWLIVHGRINTCETVLGNCALMAVFWVFWVRRIFEDVIVDEVEQLWDHIRVWALFCASVSAEFREIRFQLIHLDWKGVAL